MVIGNSNRLTMDSKNFHIKTARQIVVSPCGKFIMTAGGDGVVLVFKILKEIEGVLRD